jgi:MFS family permease
VAWGGNEFTPLLVMYRTDGQMSALTVNLLLGAYVLGIMPSLLVGGPLSDRYGRRPVLVWAPAFGIGGSAVLAAGAGQPVLLGAGRICSGVALGLVMAVGTAWVKELSEDGGGARRASMALTAGFGLGAGVAATLAQWGPWHAQLPYLVNIVLTAAAWLLLGAPETRTRMTDPGRLRDDLRIPAAGYRRFVVVVAPTAPWVFGTAASAYAILPGLLVAQVPDLAVGYSGLMCVVGLGTGVALQQTVGQRLDDPRSARGLAVAMGVAVPGLALATVTAILDSAALGLVASAVLGAAYGLLLLGGLQEVQRMATPDDLAGLTAVYYALSYLGFFVPAILAALDPLVGYPILFAVGAVLATACLVLVLANRHRALPAA